MDLSDHGFIIAKVHILGLVKIWFMTTAVCDNRIHYNWVTQWHILFCNV